MDIEQQKELDDWNPEEAKSLGSLKGIVEYKTDLEHTELDVNFSEPKLKKKVRTTPIITETGKRNKNSLF